MEAERKFLLALNRIRNDINGCKRTVVKQVHCCLFYNGSLCCIYIRKQKRFIQKSIKNIKCIMFFSEICTYIMDA